MTAKFFEPTWNHFVDGKPVCDMDSSSKKSRLVVSYVENKRKAESCFHITFLRLVEQEKDYDTFFSLSKSFVFDFVKDSKNHFKKTYRSYYKPSDRLLWHLEHRSHLEKEIREIANNSTDIYESDKWKCTNGTYSCCEDIKIRYTCIQKEDVGTQFSAYYLGLNIVYDEYEIEFLAKFMPFFDTFWDQYFYEKNKFIRITDTITGASKHEYETEQVRIKDFFWKRKKLKNGEYKPETLMDLADSLFDESPKKKTTK